VAGLVPFIKRVNSNAKIIYRSHIEIRSDLVAQPGTEQQRLWSYLSQFIHHADLFITHPIKSFIPADIDSDKILALPACTDRLDGLNKPLSRDAVRYYMDVFERLSHEQTGSTLAYPRRPYIIQIARFDPSKGNSDVLISNMINRGHVPLKFCIGV
jgi:hypothetical protein